MKRAATNGSLCLRCGNQNKGFCNPKLKAQHYHNWVKDSAINRTGLKRTDETRKRLSDSALQTYVKGRIPSNLGKPVTEETRRNIRIGICKYLLKTNSWYRVDAGSQEFVKMLNEAGFHFKEQVYFKDIGYFADAYDAVNHIWFEYDTPVHNCKRYRISDPIRQSNIIKHFESTGNPLKQFIRFDARDKNRSGIGVVYRSSYDS